MTIKQFQRLRRGDIIYGDETRAGTTNKIWLVKNKAIYVVESGKFTCHLEHCLFPDQTCDLTDDNFDRYHFTPKLEKKYGFISQNGT